jgi:hypothetical protein
LLLKITIHFQFYDVNINMQLFSWHNKNSIWLVCLEVMSVCLSTHLLESLIPKPFDGFRWNWILDT